MSKLLKIFLSICGFLGISTIALCSFLLFTSVGGKPSAKYHPSVPATEPISGSSKIKPSDTFWTSERFKF